MYRALVVVALGSAHKKAARGNGGQRRHDLRQPRVAKLAKQQPGINTLGNTQIRVGRAGDKALAHFIAKRAVGPRYVAQFKKARCGQQHGRRPGGFVAGRVQQQAHE